MTLPEITLDDRRFQDLVNEARLRISQRCPEWTEHNVSDPGITLIELFAWMTETLIYRLNRVPDKLHVALLELLGIQIAPPIAATTRAALPARRPAGRAGADPARRDRGRHGAHRRARSRSSSRRARTSRSRRRGRSPTSSSAAAASRTSASPSGVARPKGADQLAFGTPPKVGDALYLGFDDSLARHRSLQVDVDCSQARGAGVDPEDPPLRWEVSCDGRAERLGGGRGARRPDRRLQLRQRHDRAAAARRATRRDDRRPARLLGPLPPRRQDPLGRDRGHLHAPARDLLDHGRADRRARPGGPLARASTIETSARATARRGRASSSATPVLEPTDDETSRCSTRGAASGSAGSERESFVESGR